MNKTYDVYYAKLANENISIQEHTQMVMDTFNEFMTLKQRYFHENEIRMIEYSIQYHDIGKANEVFQEKMRGHYLSDEVPHGYLSVLAIRWKELKNFLSKDEFKVVLNAVYYHHRRSYFLEQDIIDFSKKYFEKQLCDYMKDDSTMLMIPNLYKIFTRDITDRNTFETWVKYVVVKGILNRCDWSASGNLPIEIEPQQSMKQNILNRFSPNQLQNFMLEHCEDNVALIASTGAGKTEAALLWLNDEKGFFTLPMKVSANAIYQRVKEHYLLSVNKTERVAILHGDCYKFYNTHDDKSLDMFDYHNAKNLSYPLTICTIDQIFKFAYKALGTEHFLATLKYSKVIIDELQAYSPDMLATIITALKYIHAVGGKFAIITATLPLFILDELSECNIQYQRYLGDISDRHKIQMHDNNLIDDIENIIENAKQKKVLIICNTVRTAQNVYSKIKELDKDVEIHLLHSRYTKSHRRQLENQIINFSKSDKSGICIATQIVEASLDIDFDVLYTYLSSIDSLIQRMGRVYRKRQNSNQITNVHVYSYKDGIGPIYDPVIYERTYECLKEYNQKMFLEEEKIQCMDRVYDKKELEQTKYMKEFKKNLNHLKKLVPLQMDLKEVDNKFRNIHSIQILPESIYNQDKVQNLIEEIESELIKTRRYELISQLSEYCIQYTLYRPLNTYKYIDNNSCVIGEEVHRSTCKYDFNEETLQGIGLDVNLQDDDESNMI